MVAIALAAASEPAAAAPRSGTIQEGNVRFQVITPSLVRLEYAADARFEDRPSMTVPDRRFRPPRHRVRTGGRVLRITTSRMVLRYRRDSGPFSPDNLSVDVVGPGAGTVRAEPRFPPPPPPSAGPPSTKLNAAVREAPGYRAPTQGNLGGWYRALDVSGQPVELHDGVLSRDGWYLLDDSHTILLQDAPPGFATRPDHRGPYQDGYLFAYGSDYKRALRDLRTLTGPAPLLPRKAFGVWFSRYWAYRQDEYAPLLERFRAARIGLDVLPIDTDFKAPHNWNGWNWNTSLFPDPKGLFDWARANDIDVPLNTHPSITIDDPDFAEAERRAGRKLPPDPTGVRCRAITLGAGAIGAGTVDVVPECRVFDWALPGDQDAYFWLHEEFERQGADFWWLDYCCDESYALAPGLTQDTWINHLYAQRNFARGSRWPVLSRIGASFFDPDAAGAGIWAEHRNTIHFTGDTRPTWAMLDFQTAFTAAEGNVGIPYVSHDIGSFAPQLNDPGARHLPDDLYVRWIQSGTFQPILRLHSDHGERLPWEYPGRAEEVATRFLRLRGELIPYLYTLARRAHDRGLPMARAMYLDWPGHEEAYRFDRQYMLGSQLLVAPVGAPGDPATKEVWFPPGPWTDVFTGERHRGPGVERLEVPLDRMPVFARAGAIVPKQEYRQGNTPPPERLVVDAYPGRRGAFRLYDDAGDGTDDRFATTRIAQRRTRRALTVTIGRPRGNYAGMPRCRRYELRLHGTRRPRSVRGGRWSHDGGTTVVRTRCVRRARVVVR